MPAHKSFILLFLSLLLFTASWVLIDLGLSPSLQKTDGAIDQPNLDQVISMQAQINTLADKLAYLESDFKNQKSNIQHNKESLASLNHTASNLTDEVRVLSQVRSASDKVRDGRFLCAPALGEHCYIVRETDINDRLGRELKGRVIREVKPYPKNSKWMIATTREGFVGIIKASDLKWECANC